MSDIDPVTRLNAALEGRYRIERELGEGGMATVYLADDIKHERKVALKVLKPELAAVVGAERFLAEIKTTANLTHPNILPLHDSGEADGFLFYVMPYVEGETLRDRLDREHQLPVDDAVQIAKDVAEALDYAHGHGVIHRDIKPANILMQAGKPVISDFGIALAVGTAGQGRLTETGLSMGTPHYMSPEQATGDLSVGAATDIYALGCVLYEMLVGEPPYTGSTAQAILGKIIAGELATATKQRASVPANVDAALRCALEKLPADRFSSTQKFASALADGHFRYGELAARVGDGVATSPWNRLTVTFAALFALATVGLGWSLLRPEPPEPPAPVARFSSPFEGAQAPITMMAAPKFTADGSALVYAGPGPSGQGTQLWIRRWADLEATPIRGTERALTHALSPDEQEVAFVVAGSTLRVVPLVGGPSRTLGEANIVWDWTSDGYIYITQASPLVLARVPATGGGSETAEILTELRAGEVAHGPLRVLPGGTMGVFQVLRSFTHEGSEIWAIDLDSRERRLLTTGSTPVYASSGHLLFGTPDGVLMAAPFDPSTAELTGSAAPVVEDLALLAFGLMGYAVSESGTLIYVSGDTDTDVVGVGALEPVWVTRSGEAVPVDPGWRFGASFSGTGLSISPDGARVAIQQLVDGNDDIWIKQLPDGPLERLTFDDGVESSPFWSPDGEFVAYTRFDAGIWQQRADGTGSPQPVIDDPRLYQGRWSPDGEWMIFRTASGAAASPDDDIVGFRPGVDSIAIPLIATAEFSEQSPALSPNGRWLAYTSDQTGRREVYVRPFPDVDSDEVTVSRAGGQNPFWAHSGNELFFVNPDGALVAAEVEASSVFRVLRRQTLFSMEAYMFDNGTDFFDMGPDDERFLMLRNSTASLDSSGDTRWVLVQNFFEVLKRLVPN